MEIQNGRLYNYNLGINRTQRVLNQLQMKGVDQKTRDGIKKRMHVHNRNRIMITIIEVMIGSRRCWCHLGVEIGFFGKTISFKCK